MLSIDSNANMMHRFLLQSFVRIEEKSMFRRDGYRRIEKSVDKNEQEDLKIDRNMKAFRRNLYKIGHKGEIIDDISNTREHADKLVKERQQRVEPAQSQMVEIKKKQPWKGAEKF